MTDIPKAVHFGAGNIGRGFVGMLLHEGGYEVVFSDVVGPLVEALEAADSYTVHEVGEGGADKVITGFRAVNSAEHPEAVASEVADAAVVTTAVGPTALTFIASHIVAGLRQRDPQDAPLQVMACENAIGATDILREAMAEASGEDWAELQVRAVFANTAVDRIVPGQPAESGINVTVESFYEWAVERAPFSGRLPQVPGAHFVDELSPFIERKLFTVNTGHAAAAYFGRSANHATIAEALADDEVAEGVAAALQETSALLVSKHGFPPEEMADYRATILDRFRNPALPDTVDRVGRQPLRKLSRNERLIGPAAEAAERGLAVEGLLCAVAAALRFDLEADQQAGQLQSLLTQLDAEAFTQRVTGLDEQHPLYALVVERVRLHQSG